MIIFPKYCLWHKFNCPCYVWIWILWMRSPLPFMLLSCSVLHKSRRNENDLRLTRVRCWVLTVTGQNIPNLLMGPTLINTATIHYTKDNSHRHCIPNYTKKTLIKLGYLILHYMASKPFQKNWLLASSTPCTLSSQLVFPSDQNNLSSHKNMWRQTPYCPSCLIDHRRPLSNWISSFCLMAYFR